MKEKLYMVVTSDKYELPIDFSTSVGELAKKYNVTCNSIYSCVSKKRNGKNNGFKFIKVYI